MKTILPLTLSFLLCSAILLAEYPFGEVIQPYPAPVIEQTLRQRFDCNPEGTAQWRALHQAVLTPLAESLQVESEGHDPYILLPPIAGTPRAGTFEFRIRMKNRMNPHAEIFWTTTAQPDFLAENALRFDFVPDGEWYTYSVQFTSTDPLTRLRFDPGISTGVAEIAWVELYDLTHGEVPENPTPWVDPNWIEKVEEWHTLSLENIKINFCAKGTGAVVFIDDEAVGEIYPLAYTNPTLPLGGVKRVPFAETQIDTPPVGQPFDWKSVDKLPMEEGIILHTPQWSFNPSDWEGMIRLAFSLRDDELFFVMYHLHLGHIPTPAMFGPVFRPYGEMQQALLSGVDYLEKGEHSSATASIETREHLRFAPKPMDLTMPFMSIVTDKVAFGLLWDDPHLQPIFATPDFILGDPTKHHMGLYGQRISGTLKIMPVETADGGQQTAAERAGGVSPPVNNEPRMLKSDDVLTPLDTLILWAFNKRGGAPDVPRRFRNDEEQRLLSLAAFEQSIIVCPHGGGWRHAAMPGTEADTLPFHVMYGSDFVTTIWQLTGELPEDLTRTLAPGGGHLPNPASYFLMGQAAEFRDWKRNESRLFRSQQRPDGSFPYSGKYLRGHWEDTASGHCGYKLYQLLYTYQILGEPEALEAARKGLAFANQYTVPRGAQTWELSLHTPDIMGASRMCMANVWAYEATGDKKYLAHAVKWAIRGLPFVYLWETKPLAGRDDPIMLYATTPVFGATDWVAPNWIGLPVQWCGLDYAEACFMLSKHDDTVDWRKIAEGILTTAERMQYTEGPSIGLLPDAWNITLQIPLPFDINPSVLVQQRRRLQGKIPSLDIVLSADKQFRVVSPYPTTIEGNVAVIEGVAGTVYQILVNGEVRTVESQGVDRVALCSMTIRNCYPCSSHHEKLAL